MFSLNQNIDRKQTLRMRRFFIAFSGYGVIALAVGASHYAGFTRDVHPPGLLMLLLAALLANGLVFLLIWTGINKRFRDPGLTLLQMVLAVILNTILCYYLDSSLRGAGTVIYIMIFLFGTFRVKLPPLFVLALVTTFLYAASMAVLYLAHPAALNVKLEIVRCGILVVSLLWISYMADYIATLRRKIKRLASRDPLTGVYNRREIYEQLEREKALSDRSGQSFSLCVIDLDDFKRVNDTYGHQAGDAVLAKFAALIRDNVRAEDYIGRFGGEEFFVVLVNFECSPENDDPECLKRLLRVPRQLKFPEISEELRLTVSIGVAVYQPFKSIDALVKRADQALYQAKEKGKNRIEFGGFVQKGA